VKERNLDTGRRRRFTAGRKRKIIYILDIGTHIPRTLLGMLLIPVLWGKQMSKGEMDELYVNAVLLIPLAHFRLLLMNSRVAAVSGDGEFRHG
jgi:hypothetical protein